MIIQRNLFFYCLAATVIAGAAEAAAPQRLAFSEKLGVEVFALPNSKGVWCLPTMTLNIMVKDNSALLQAGGISGFLPKLNTVFDRECSQATTAKVSVIKTQDHSVVGSLLNISKAEGWTVSPSTPEPVAIAQKAESQTAPVVQPKSAPQPVVASVVPAQAAKQPAAISQPPVAVPTPAIVQQPAAAVPAVVQQPTVAVATPVITLPQPPVVVSQAVTAEPTTLPRDFGYFSALIQYLRTNPALAEDDGLIHLWASYRFPREYEQVVNQEFKLQSIIQKAKEDLAATLLQADAGKVNIIFKSDFAAYDFTKQMFPIAINGHEFRLPKPCCIQSPNVPNSFGLKVLDIDAITGLPMDNAAAEVFAEKRTQYGRINRTMSIAVSVKLDSAGLVKDSLGVIAASGTLETASFLSDKEDRGILYQISQSELQTMHETKVAEKALAAKEEADQQAVIYRQQAVANRDQDIMTLSQATNSVKFANIISDGQINYRHNLNNLRYARADAILKNHPVNISMLVQMDASGRNEVATTWPGHLKITVPENLPELKSSGWYLVRGLLSVPDGNDLPAAALVANAIFACTQPKCADATDATTIVDHKLAAINGGL